jgi:hypothetical protein
MNVINDIGVLVGLVALAAFLIAGTVLALADTNPKEKHQ